MEKRRASVLAVHQGAIPILRGGWRGEGEGGRGGNSSLCTRRGAPQPQWTTHLLGLHRYQILEKKITRQHFPLSAPSYLETTHGNGNFVKLFYCGVWLTGQRGGGRSGWRWLLKRRLWFGAAGWSTGWLGAIVWEVSAPHALSLPTSDTQAHTSTSETPLALIFWWWKSPSITKGKEGHSKF